MAFTVSQIAERTGLSFVGDGTLEVTGAAEPGLARESQLALAMSPDFADALSEGHARAAVLWPDADWRALGLEAALFAPRPRIVLAEMGELFDKGPELTEGTHPTAVIADSAEIGANARIGPFAVIGPRVRIGADARIAAHVTVGEDSTIGPNALLHAGVRIAHGVTIGARFIAQSNAVLGSDGFSYVTPDPGAVESAKRTGGVSDAARNLAFRRIASLGGLEIGDDVEVGAGACIDRGTIASTTIGNGAKIDNLVQIGHNCRIGSLCLLCGHVGLAGSVTVGDRAVLGGKTGVADHLTIGHDSVLAGGSLVGTNIAPGTVALGAPAIDRKEAQRMMMAMRRLPRAIEQLREIRRKLGL